MSKSPTSVNRKALKLDDKVKVINRYDQWWEKLLGCGRGEGCWSYPSSNNKTLNARLLARVITGCHYT